MEAGGFLYFWLGSQGGGQALGEHPNFLEMSLSPEFNVF